MTAKWNWLTGISVGLVCLSQGCSLEKPEANSGSLQIKLEDQQQDLAQSSIMVSPNLDADSLGDIGILAPTTISDFNCFAVNVTGAGVPTSARLDGCTLTDNFGGHGTGILSDPVSRGKPITVDVPSGLKRIIDVVGIYPPTSECGGTGGGTNDGYIVGSQVVDLLEPKAVTIPISFSNTGKAISCTGGGHASFTPPLLTAGHTSTCTSFFAPPTTPAPTTTPIGGTFSGGDITEVSTDNGTMINSECSASSSQMGVMEFHFDVTGMNLANTSRFNIVWKGLVGYYGGACSMAASVSTTGGQIYIYNYDNGASPNWVQIGGNSIQTTGIETITGTFSTTPSQFTFNNRIVVRVITPSTSISTCATVRTDYIKLIID